jgi:hypothetical protein
MQVPKLEDKKEQNEEERKSVVVKPTEELSLVGGNS